MTRVDRTVLVPPPRREAYPPAATKGSEDLPEDKTFGATVDFSLWKGLQALQTHANQRSNPSGGGIDSLQAFSDGERLSVTLPSGYVAGTEIRVPHRLKRKPTAIVWFTTQNPAFALRGVPDGSTGANSNSPWTARDVFVVSDGTAGTVFDFIVA